MKTESVDCNDHVQDIVNVVLFILLAFSLRICVIWISSLVKRIDPNILIIGSIVFLYLVVHYFDVEIVRKKK